MGTCIIVICLIGLPSMGLANEAGLSRLPRVIAAQFQTMRALVQTGHRFLLYPSGDVRGSAIILHPGDRAVSAAHSVEPGTHTIMLADTDHTMAAGRIAMRDDDLDLLLICLDRFVPGSIRLRKHPVGKQFAMAIGANTNHQRRYSFGWLADAATGSDHPALELELKAAPGYSGGPVLSRRGRLLGMLIEYSPDAARSRMVPAPALSAFVSEHRETCA